MAQKKTKGSGFRVVLYVKAGCPDSEAAVKACKDAGITHRAIMVNPEKPPKRMKEMGWDGHFPLVQVIRVMEEPSIAVLLRAAGKRPKKAQAAEAAAPAS